MSRKQAILLILAALLIGLALQPAQASRASRDAISDCEREMEHRHDADSFHDVFVSDRGRGYKVTGFAEKHGHDSEYFECWTEYGRVEDIEFEGWKTSSSDKAKAVAAGVALAAVVAAAAASSKNHHKYEGDYQYDPPSRDYRDRSGPWYPASGVTCYANIRQCYSAGSGYSAYWTRREFH